MVKTTTTDGSININYYQMVPMTFEEKVNMYMKCSKLDLAKMLAERDNITQPIIYPYPYIPQTPVTPYYEWYTTCDGTNKIEDNIKK